MKKQLYFILLTLVVALTMTSCFGLGNGPSNNDPDLSTYTETKMFGRWQNTIDTTAFKIFSDEMVTATQFKENTGEEKTDNFFWGKEWDESEVEESDLVEYGNGWFMWRFTSATKKAIEVIEWQTMDNHSAAIPVTYTISTLTDKELSYKTASGKVLKFKKIAKK